MDDWAERRNTCLVGGGVGGVFASLMATKKVELEHPCHLGGSERGGLARLFTHKVVMEPGLECGEEFVGLCA